MTPYRVFYFFFFSKSFFPATIPPRRFWTSSNKTSYIRLWDPKNCRTFPKRIKRVKYKKIGRSFVERPVLVDAVPRRTEGPCCYLLPEMTDSGTSCAPRHRKSISLATPCWVGRQKPRVELTAPATLGPSIGHRTDFFCLYRRSAPSRQGLRWITWGCGQSSHIFLFFSILLLSVELPRGFVRGL